MPDKNIQLIARHQEDKKVFRIAVCDDEEYNFLNGKKSVLVDAVLYVESRLHKVIFFVMENETIKEYCKY